MVVARVPQALTTLLAQAWPTSVTEAAAERAAMDRDLLVVTEETEVSTVGVAAVVVLAPLRERHQPLGMVAMAQMAA